MITTRCFHWLSLIPILGIVLPLSAEARYLAPGHVPKIVKSLQATGELPAATQLNLAIGLPLRNTQALEKLAQELYDPSSPAFHHFLTPDEFTAQFGPTDDQYKQVAAFARSNNLVVMRSHSNRMLLDVSGAAGEVEKTFGVHLRTYHRPTGKGDFYAPDVEPSVQGDIPILDVSGLSDYQRPQPMLRQRTPMEELANAQPNTGSASSGAYMGGDFRAAYIPGVSLTGAGQTVGMVEFDGFYANDITSYESQAHLSPVSVEAVLLDGYNGTPTTGSDSGNPEVSLDIEMAISMAPGLSHVISYEAGPTGNPNDILNRMVTDNLAKQLSCSWTWSGGPSATTDQIFQQMAVQGQSFFNAAGDSDAYTGGSLDSPSANTAPADSPYVTSVGGTTLTTSGPGGFWVSETVWNWNDGTGTSGGTSSHYSIPSWQQGISMAANGGSTTMRNIPDVALTGDNIYVVYGNGSSGTFGGTSCATPLWAAFIALVNQQAGNYGMSPMGFINPAIYAIGKGATYTSVFHDITTGNDTSTSSPDEFYATTGYDLCSGWGTPIGGLINALTTPPDALGVSPAAGFSSSGLIGGPFNNSSEVFSLTNSGSQALAWSLANTSLWLNVSSSGGTLSPGATATPVTVGLNAVASSLPGGVYTTTLWFTNLTSGFVTSRQFTLTASSQLVQNGGFETGTLTNWTQSGNTAYTQVTSAGSYVHSGSCGAELGPSGTLGYLSQTMPTTVGQPYLLSLWFTNPKPGGSPNQFTISWNGTNLFNQTDVAVMGWTNLQFTVAATSTNSVLQFGFLNDPGYFGLDDVSLTPVATPSLQVVAMANTTMQFSLNTTAGVQYQAQYLTNLGQTNWINLGQPFTATNTVTTINDTGAVDAQRFYRVVIQP
jgi:subtilase family serine protease